ncbi:hypothetical protein [Siccirubricoccus sp. G192]|uniref:hypothetical protein n=1 Tax=Siccirubricoccus sp. G192 TaxID=2849651 RepID=UPI001C2BD08D|nr:hypothetical protein [Siccirubricoccus sp. G192]MBV1798578.1 hypothetical protein [Siccirubricoccus sp. G192]
MDGTAAANFPFLPSGASRQGIALLCLRRFAEPGGILVHCRGIEVGHLPLRRAIEPDEVLEVQVARLPRVALPAELRFSLAIDGPDLAPPWRLEAPAAALTLLGPPAPRVEDVTLDHGVLRGVAVERVNGLLDPVLYARINDAGARAVTVEAPVALAEGGCAFRFALALEPADLGETGLAVTLQLVGMAGPLARFAWTRAGAGEAERRVAELEGRLRRLEQIAAGGLAEAQAAMQRRLDIQQERIDAFIEAAASLLLDRLAREPEASAPQALRDLIATTAPPVPETAPLRLGARVELSPGAGNLGPGWHAPERDAEGAFRWMADRALVVNPEPDRPVEAVELEVSHLYRSPAPALQASFDDLPCAVAVAPAGPRRFTLRITPPEGAAPCRSLHLESLASGSPAQDGVSADSRLLSLAVARLVFHYGD